jgi:glycosyltransferase involved in cell wall biosynthesis
VIVPALWRQPGITTVGFMEDVTPLYERATAMLAPILGGTGIRIKLLEAFRHGVPVITTPDGAAGLPIETGREAYIEAEAGAFADRAIELATSSDRRDRLREAGYQFLERHNALTEAQAVASSLLGLTLASGRLDDRHPDGAQRPDQGESPPRVPASFSADG